MKYCPIASFRPAERFQLFKKKYIKVLCDEECALYDSTNSGCILRTLVIEAIKIEEALRDLHK